MIKFENLEITGWEAALRGMRNPLNSWDKGDSYFKGIAETDVLDEDNGKVSKHRVYYDALGIGPVDYDLIKRLRNAGTDHRKFMRMITVFVDITAPLYWWKEFDTYKVGTVANSCSTMHKIHAKEFTLEDFSCERLLGGDMGTFIPTPNNNHITVSPKEVLERFIIPVLNHARTEFIETKDKKYWHQMIQLLPSSYNQKRTVMMNYEVLANIYKSRKNHKLDEWKEHDPVNITNNEKIVRTIPNFNIGFCDWIKTLPYHEFITGEFE